MSEAKLQGRNAVRHRASYDRPQPDHPEAIAMRRIVVEMGCWLSPLLKDHPIPTLTEWEATCDLVAAAHVWRAKAKAKARGFADEVPTRNGGRERAYSTPTFAEVRDKRNRRGPASPEIEAVGAVARPEPLPKPTPKPAPVPTPPVDSGKWVSLKSTAPKPPPPPPPSRNAEPKRPAVKVEHTPESMANAIARISAIAEAKKAEDEAAKALREARRLETARAANKAFALRHKQRMETDPDYAAKVRAKDREGYAKRNAAAIAAREAKRAERNTPEAIAARKAKEYAARRKKAQDRIAADPALAERLREEEKQRKRDRMAKARAVLDAKRRMPTAKELVAEARKAAGLEP